MSAPEAPAPAAAKSAPVAPSVKSEPVAPAPAEQVSDRERRGRRSGYRRRARAASSRSAGSVGLTWRSWSWKRRRSSRRKKAWRDLRSRPRRRSRTPEAAAWAFKSVELWSENAQAMMGFASALGKAKSLTEVVELQSRFASERFNRFAKLAGEAVPPPKFFFFAAKRNSLLACGRRRDRVASPVYGRRDCVALIASRRSARAASASRPA